MTLSQNAKFNHPKTEIFGSTCANSTEAFFEAHQIFARPILSITSIALYWTASFNNSSLRLRIASPHSCLRT